MFDQIGKVFDRNFVVAFYLPVLVLAAISAGLLSRPVNLSQLVAVDATKLPQVTILLIASWFFAIFLQAIVSQIYQIFEGYWPYFQRVARFYQVWKFERLQRRSKRLKAAGDAAKLEGIPFKGQRERNAVTKMLAIYFPSRRELVLPTKFGNILRAFEDYPRSLYGFESIDGWYRLQAVIPSDVSSIVESSRAATDFWVNFTVVGLVLALELVVDGLRHWRLPSTGVRQVWFALAALAFAWFSYSQACNAAVKWGHTVKAAFDVFLPDLANKLGYKLPSDPAEVRRFWRAFSIVMVYRREDIFEHDLAIYRSPSATD